MNTFYSRIAKWFPIPKLMSMRHVGVHISSDDHITMLELVYRDGRIIPKAHERVVIPPSEEEDNKPLIQALTNLRKKYHLEFAKVSIPESKSYLFEAEVPKSEGENDHHNLHDSVAFTIEEKAPVSLADIVFGYKVIDENADSFTVCVGVVPQKIIEESIEMFSSAGITPLTFKIEAQAVANAVIPEYSKENTIIVSIKHSKTIIAIVQNGGVLMSTTVEFGGAIFDTLLEKAGYTDKELRKEKFNQNFITE
jgi:Tfp pilus assembly PilM family ATPase